jgi:hypothetical protein
MTQATVRVSNGAMAHPTQCIPSLDVLGGGAEMATHAFRLRPIMKQGTAAGIPETWTHYSSVEDARAGAKLMDHNDRVLRVMLLT